MKSRRELESKGIVDEGRAQDPLRSIGRSGKPNQGRLENLANDTSVDPYLNMNDTRSCMVCGFKIKDSQVTRSGQKRASYIVHV